MKEEERGLWINSFLMAIVKTLRIVMLPFDLKVLLFIGFEYVSNFLYKMLYVEKEANTNEKKSTPDDANNIIRKTAVLLDGTSKHGLFLRNKLLEKGYSVILPSDAETTSENVINIPIKIRNEESIDLFVKKVSIYGAIDLLLVNSSDYSLIKQKIQPIKGVEKKILPSRKKTGFVSKSELYKEKNRILLEKDHNARRNYLFNFLLIRGLSEKLKSGSGMVVVCTHRIFMLANEVETILPSYTFSYCHSQLLHLFLGIGAKARYNYLDVRIVRSDFFNDLWVDGAIHCIQQPKRQEIQYFDNFQALQLDKKYTDRANDIWESAEMIS